MNVYYFNGAGTSVKTIHSGYTYYYSHWLEVQHAVNDWNNTQYTKIWFVSTDDKSKSILDFMNTSFPDTQLMGQTTFWIGNNMVDPKTTNWYWAKVEMNSNPYYNWRINTLTGQSSNEIAVGKIRHNAAHEMGHALGLDHVGQYFWNYDKLMYPNANSYYLNGIIGPTADEVSGVQDIYGRYNY
jgi:hypothetical protein